jgi:hypothetical protein
MQDAHVKQPKTLDPLAQQVVSYCIPDWLKNEQIRVNTATVRGRLQAAESTRPEPIALVNYGPSLNDTWEQIRGFKYVMTCSGAHKFLTDRGIVPTHHIDVDPRAHKVELLGEPVAGCEYLIASTCHPKLFERLADFDLKLWHVFDTQEEGLRILPQGEWAITGGCSAGVRTLTIARFLGFTDLHVFGMDGNEGASGKHAGPHPNQPPTSHLTTYGGKEYRTTPAMLTAVQNVFHEIDMMRDVRVKFYGEGLCQAMARDHVRKEVPAGASIGFIKQLISAEYRELNARLHRENLAYGVGGGKHADTVLKLVKSLTKDCAPLPVSVLDYGAGKGYLAKALPFPIAEYDPCVPGKEESPRPADLVVCTDVLEHIEPDRLGDVLSDLQRVTRRVGYFVIHTGPSTKHLADGRNSHLIQQGRDWWLAQLRNYFSVPDAGCIASGPLLYCVVGPKQKLKKVKAKHKHKAIVA